jgi:hypothetical protein
MRFLQKQLVNSAGAKLLAVRKVTQDNRGIRIPGVDGMLYTTGSLRLKLATSLRFDGRSDCNFVIINKNIIFSIPEVGPQEKPCELKSSCTVWK